MILKIFAVKDLGTNEFFNPLFTVHTAHSIRGFTDEINRSAEGNQLYQHPDDFELYHIGTFDTSVGKFDSIFPERVAAGKDVKSVR